MAEKNIVLDNPFNLMNVHGITQEEINNPAEDGCVGTRQVNGEIIKYYVNVRQTAQLPNQQGDR